ncbi:thioesterase II family protein [Streptomyces sp. NBC_00078]|uniref:thioesterase II family protein n=1 Tax=unclassified Streptomyces TaxID=2593676 RepID=UPI0022566D15|nr:thioesterase domain-containing protein [Streptomyces sp. NBC_00078]MCX5418119.1 thioesterase domain-containing protein [Streptomyces sp. NBC_00078]MCX5426157.1 thioesterase domain-containing protein [Streptomyces sp. NBC_00078]
MTPLALPEEHPDHPARTVLVVPHAGGGSGTAKPLRAALPDDCLVAGVVFGGRESRFPDEPPTRLTDLVEDTVTAAEEATALTGRTPVLLGQCSGALVAWLASIELARRGRPAPGLVVVSRSAPAWPGELPDATGSDGDFLRQVTDMGGVPEEVAAMPELLDLLLPSLRADFTALADWRPERTDPAAASPVPALALYAPDDPGCPVESVEAWRPCVGGLDVAPVKGGHLLLATNAGGVAERLTAWLSQTAPEGNRRAGNG